MPAAFDMMPAFEDAAAAEVTVFWRVVNSRIMAAFSRHVSKYSDIAGAVAVRRCPTEHFSPKKLPRPRTPGQQFHRQAFFMSV
jgi:hypothetical protein